MLETTEELEELSKEVRTTASPERLQANAQTISDLVASGLSASALREGDVAPEFALPDTHGHVLALKTLRDRGPVVISFYPWRLVSLLQSRTTWPSACSP